MNDEHGILGSELFGFDTVSSNSIANDENLHDHPGFKMIVDLMNTDITKLEIWMQEGDLTTNKKGLLWKYTKSTNPAQMTRSQLIQQIKEWGPAIKEFEELKQTHSILLIKHSETEAAYEQMLSRYEMERSLNEEFMEKLKAKIRECGELQRELINLRPMQNE
jgi:hypothetical protein